MYKGVTILYNGRLVSNSDDCIQKSIFGWILGGMGEDRTVLRRKNGKFYRLASVKKD
ncbi:MAG: hypothetical protein JW776_09095 [Candidatus Lokiarchaeota archaeon]|nr:hypothetical protein [Candidatus Lokiarchaeota archaeon]